MGVFEARMIHIISLLNTDRQSVIVRLSNVDVRILVWRQPRDKGWYIDLEIPVGNPIVSGRRLAHESSVFGRLVVDLPGEIWCRALSPSEEEPGLAPWGITHVLTYERDG